jgi:hypothetical protein
MHTARPATNQASHPPPRSHTPQCVIDRYVYERNTIDLTAEASPKARSTTVVRKLGDRPMAVRSAKRRPSTMCAYVIRIHFCFSKSLVYKHPHDAVKADQPQANAPWCETQWEKCPLGTYVRTPAGMSIEQSPYARLCTGVYV